jgi:hypothetical protein
MRDAPKPGQSCWSKLKSLEGQAMVVQFLDQNQEGFFMCIFHFVVDHIEVVIN